MIPTRRVSTSLAAPLIVFVAVLLIWQIAVAATGVERYLLPGPLDVAGAIYSEPGVLLSATTLTAAAAAMGFLASLVIGVAIAVTFSLSGWVRAGFYPYAIFLQTVPIVAVAPLIVVWFGYGLRSVTLVAFIISLFPIITNATTGLMSVDRDLLDLFELYNAGRAKRLLKLQLPASVPYIIAGAKISAGMAVIGAIVGEFFLGFGATRFGLGYLIMQASTQMKTAELFAAVFASTLLGVVVFIAVQMTGNRLLKRWSGGSPT